MSAAQTLAFPSLAAPEVWLSSDQTLKLCGWTIQWLRERVRCKEVRVRTTECKLGNGHFAKEYLLTSLPAEARRRYAAEQAKAPAQPQQAELSLFSPRLIQAPRVAAPKKLETAVEARRRILEPLLDYRANESVRRTFAATITLTGGQPVNSLNRAIEWVIEREAAKGRIFTARNIKRWLAAHKLEGEAGLARRRRADKGQSRFFANPAHHAAGIVMVDMHLGNGLLPPMSVQACYDMLVAQPETVGLTPATLPSKSALHAFLSQLPTALRTYCRKGARALNEKHLPHIFRSYAQPAMAIWVSDTMIADVEVQNDLFDGVEFGAPCRLRLTAIIDFKSRYVVGYSWCFEGSSRSIATAFRMGAAQHGPPENWYCDNGRDYKKVARGAVQGFERDAEDEPWKLDELHQIERTGILARFGVRVTHCIPHWPQSKHIERFFRTVHEDFCQLWPTYTGGKPSERPENTTALMALHRRALKAGALEKSQHPPASEFIQRFAAWLEVYHHRAHNGEAMNGRSPDEVFRTERSGKPRPTLAAEQLAHLYWDETTALIRRGAVRVNRVVYAAAGLEQSKLLLDRDREKVIVRFDPLDPSMIAILDDDGHLVTMLQPVRRVDQNPADPAVQAQIGEMMHTRGALVKGLREQRKAINRAGRQIGMLRPLQLLEASPAQPAIDKLPAVVEANTPSVVQRKPRFQSATYRRPQSAFDLAAEIFKEEK